MVRVYKTNVNEPSRAKSVLEALRKNIPGCDPSFDLKDCDKVLRIANPSAGIEESQIHRILHQYGYSMESLL